MESPLRGFLHGVIHIQYINHMNRFTTYLQETKAEMKHVKWPTQTQTFIYTGLIILISILVAMFLGAFDYIFTQFLNSVIR